MEENHRVKVRPIARIFRRGVTWMSELQKHARLGGSGGMLPQESLEIICSEIASEAILGQKQSHISYLAHGVLHPNFGCHACMHLLSQLTSNLHKRRYKVWQNSRWSDIIRRKTLERLN